MSRQSGVVFCLLLCVALLPNTQLAAQSAPILLSNASVDLGSSPPTVTLQKVQGKFGKLLGKVWQVVEGVPEALVIVSWAETGIVAELASVVPGDYLMAVVPGGETPQQRVYFPMTVPDANPAPPCFDDSVRFVDCGNGTVADSASGLVWLLQATCLGGTWSQANDLAALLQDGNCGLTDGSRPGDWRLPSQEEWEALVDSSCPLPPKMVGNGPYGGCYTDDPWASGSLIGFFWTSSTDPTLTDHAFGADLSFGFVVNYMKSAIAHPAWPVRDGR